MNELEEAEIKFETLLINTNNAELINAYTDLKLILRELLIQLDGNERA